MELIGKEHLTFSLKLTQQYLTGREYFNRNFVQNYKGKISNYPKEIYGLRRIKSRLRVIFIGYSYDIKFI